VACGVRPGLVFDSACVPGRGAGSALAGGRRRGVHAHQTVRVPACRGSACSGTLALCTGACMSCRPARPLSPPSPPLLLRPVTLPFDTPGASCSMCAARRGGEAASFCIDEIRADICRERKGSPRLINCAWHLRNPLSGIAWPPRHAMHLAAGACKRGIGWAACPQQCVGWESCLWHLAGILFASVIRCRRYTRSSQVRRGTLYRCFAPRCIVHVPERSRTLCVLACGVETRWDLHATRPACSRRRAGRSARA
jgi:hypothetical protein